MPTHPNDPNEQLKTLLNIVTTLSDTLSDDHRRKVAQLIGCLDSLLASGSLVPRRQRALFGAVLEHLLSTNVSSLPSFSV